MKIKTSELTGKALDYAVALCEGRREPDLMGNFDVAWYSWPNSHYCTNWDISGPIIEREGIGILAPVVRRLGDDNHAFPVNHWRGRIGRDDADQPLYQIGSSPLVAAMRCYVASKLGDIVEIPDSLA